MKRVVNAAGKLSEKSYPGYRFTGEPLRFDRNGRDMRRKGPDDWKEKLALVEDLIADYDCKVGGSSPLGCNLICGQQEGDVFEIQISFEQSLEDVEDAVLEVLG